MVQGKYSGNGETSGNEVRASIQSSPIGPAACVFHELLGLMKSNVAARTSRPEPGE